MSAGIVLGVAVMLVGCSGNSDAKNLKEATATPVAGQSAQAVATSTKAAEPTSTSAPTATPTATSVPAEVKLVESGFASYASSLGGYNVPWAAVFTNTSSTQMAANTKVTVLFYDANNVLLKSADQTLPLIFAGQTVAAGDSFLVSVPSVPARMDVRIAGTSFQTGKTALSLTVGDAAFVADKYSPKVTAKITSPFDKDLTSIKLVCIASVGGKYEAVGSSFLDLLPAATTAVGSCSIDSRLTVSSGATVRLFATASNLTTIGQ